MECGKQVNEHLIHCAPAHFLQARGRGSQVGWKAYSLIFRDGNSQKPTLPCQVSALPAAHLMLACDFTGHAFPARWGIVKQQLR